MTISTEAERKILDAQFKLPSSMIAVKHQKEDLPYDSKYPLFLFIWTLLSIGRYILIR